MQESRNHATWARIGSALFQRTSMRAVECAICDCDQTKRNSKHFKTLRAYGHLHTVQSAFSEIQSLYPTFTTGLVAASDGHRTISPRRVLCDTALGTPPVWRAPPSWVLTLDFLLYTHVSCKNAHWETRNTCQHLTGNGKLPFNLYESSENGLSQCSFHLLNCIKSSNPLVSRKQ